MLGAVSASLLNVRSMPTVTSAVVGQLTQGMVIVGNKMHQTWVQFRFGGTFGFVSAHYLQPVNDLMRLTGTVNTDLLNIRDAPNSGAKTLASVGRGASIKTLAVINDWIEIEFNGQLAYTLAQHVDLVYAESGHYAKVIANTLNVRSAPTSNASLFGQLAADTRIWVEGEQQRWSQIRFNGNRGYVASDYLQVDDPQFEPLQKSLAEHEGLFDIPQVEQDLQLPRLTPQTLLTVTGDPQQRAIAATWNRWGALLEDLSRNKQLDVACALAVLCVESSGKGFEQNNGDRLIIRFENHKFWTYWGRHHPQHYRQHFSYSPNKVWTEHQWRSQSQDPWQGFHGQQSAEWRVFEFAQQLDKNAAMLSISMGAPQIMGFHFERLGYQSVNEMFNTFSSGIQGQINGLFDFFSDPMHTFLREQAFEDFAALYNGKGQKKIYGQRIALHFEAFKKMYRV